MFVIFICWCQVVLAVIEISCKTKAVKVKTYLFHRRSFINVAAETEIKIGT